MDLFKNYIRISESIAAFFLGVQTSEDERNLEEWKKETGHHKDLADNLMNRDEYLANEDLLGRFRAEDVWGNVEKSLDKGRLRRITYRIFLKYAVVLLLLVAMGGGYLYLNRDIRVDETVLSFTPQIVSGVKGAKLLLGDGSVVNVTRDSQFAIREINGTMISKDSAGIDYTRHGDLNADKVVYNEMQTLKGMEYALTLSDGTKVYLNAESRLKFPVHFTGKERVVELTGEAYFDVVKDNSHPFVVKSGNVNIRVLGTSFNVRSYQDERELVTTLVKGKVRVNEKNIIPGEQAVYNTLTGHLLVQKVETDLYVAWKDGQFIFRNERLEDVMRTLSRWYGVEYYFLDEATKDIRIGANFCRYDNMNPILDMLKKLELVSVVQTNMSIYISVKK